jgi:rhodanese-related sulfurtransferase
MAALTPDPAATRPTARRREPARTLLEAALVGTLGLGVALAANRLSPRGLSLGRNYFPAAPAVNPAAPSAPSAPSAPLAPLAPLARSAASGSNVVASPVATPVPSPASTNLADARASATAEVAARLAARGLRMIDTAEARRLFEDPRRGQELVVFVDARNEAHFAEGHVPGAYLFDRYYPENHLPTVVPACLSAEVVVVYCLGGECEDSELAAVALQEAGVAAGRLGVYAGGMTEWAAAGMPIESGPRGSGRLTEAGR